MCCYARGRVCVFMLGDGCVLLCWGRLRVVMLGDGCGLLCKGRKWTNCNSEESAYLCSARGMLGVVDMYSMQSATSLKEFREKPQMCGERVRY